MTHYLYLPYDYRDAPDAEKVQTLRTIMEQIHPIAVSGRLLDAACTLLRRSARFGPTECDLPRFVPIDTSIQSTCVGVPRGAHDDVVGTSSVDIVRS